MKLTLEQLLQQGIEAQKAGRIKDADKYYTAIIKAQPKHSAANHNLGVLAVGIDRVNEALPFLKTALEADPSKAQYWISYIDALIKLEKIDVAKSIFEQAKSNGAQGDIFDKLGEKLEKASISKDIIPTAKEPTDDQLQLLMNLYKQGRFQQVSEQTQILTKQYPTSLNLWNLLGASAAQIGQYDQAVLAFKEAIKIKPEYADAYNNMGNVFQDQGKLDEAIEAFKAISLKPDLYGAYFNIGNALQKQGKLVKSIEAYSKAISLKPDYAVAYYNMGNTLRKQIKLDEAIEAYSKAISLKPDYPEVYYNLGLSLKEQDKLGEAVKAFDRVNSQAAKARSLECVYMLKNYTDLNKRRANYLKKIVEIFALQR